MECFDGVVFFFDNSIVVFDGFFDGLQSFQLFDIFGKYICCLIEVDDEEDLSFGSIFVDKIGCILLVCNGGWLCVQIYNKDGDEYDVEMELGEGDLESLEKVIFYDG